MSALQRSVSDQLLGGEPSGAQPAGIGGWLLVLCVLLVGWQPFSTAIVAASTVSSLGFYGLPVTLVLVARVLVTAFGVAAGLALIGRRTGAVTMAKASLAASAATDLFVYTTPYFPNNRAPGDTTLYVIALLTYYIIWLAYLFRSKRVRNTFTS